MFTKFFAAWLVVLIIVPFTAPFSTCDPTSLFGMAPGQHVPVAPRRSVALTNDATVPASPFVSAARTRMPPLSRVSRAESAAPSLGATLISSAASPGSIRKQTVVHTILRV
jgi:hypothetical protein